MGWNCKGDGIMSKLIMMKGLPGSGKTTQAKLLSNPSGYVRVNKDDLRAMMNDSKWSKGNESFVLQVRDFIISEALYAGKNVVVDDTNFEAKHRLTLSSLAKKYGATFEEVFIDTPLDECIERDLKRPNSVGSKVIKNMYEKYLRLEPITVNYNPKLVDCIICDIDGTLAHIVDRSPYDYSRVSEDTVDPVVRKLVNQEARGYRIILVSGRPDTCREATEKWLEDNRISYHELLMRDPLLVNDKGQQLDDRIIKEWIYDKEIKPYYNVQYVLDDRDRVVKMWRSIGLKVLQVAEGDF